MTLITIFLSVLSIVSNPASRVQPESPAHTCLSTEEFELADLINDYREAKGLPEIELSASLCFVAQVHARDLSENKPYDDKKCNPHSWSASGNWTACCYDSKHSDPECMWNKPRELTDYPSEGYEVVAMGYNEGDDNYAMEPETAFELWRESPGHSSVILNEKSFSDVEWNALGIGIYKGHACVWFGTEPDPAGAPGTCP